MAKPVEARVQESDISHLLLITIMRPVPRRRSETCTWYTPPTDLPMLHAKGQVTRKEIAFAVLSRMMIDIAFTRVVDVLHTYLLFPSTKRAG